MVKVVPTLEDCQTHDMHETLIMAYASNRSNIEFTHLSRQVCLLQCSPLLDCQLLLIPHEEEHQQPLRTLKLEAQSGFYSRTSQGTYAAGPSNFRLSAKARA